MKKFLTQAWGITLAVLLLAPTAISAHEPSVNITLIDGQDATGGTVNLSVASLPTTVDITGTVVHENPGNLDGVKLTLADNSSVFYGPTNYFAGIGNVGSSAFTVPWTITAAGSHTIVATVTHGNDDGTDTVVVTITINVNVTQCPAAPSIAAHHLQDLGVKSGSKTYKNTVSQVALHMGPGTDFDGVTACDAGYLTTVEAYVDNLLLNPVSK